MNGLQNEENAQILFVQAQFQRIPCQLELISNVAVALRHCADRKDIVKFDFDTIQLSCKYNRTEHDNKITYRWAELGRELYSFAGLWFDAPFQALMELITLLIEREGLRQKKLQSETYARELTLFTAATEATFFELEQTRQIKEEFTRLGIQLDAVQQVCGQLQNVEEKYSAQFDWAGMRQAAVDAPQDRLLVPFEGYKGPVFVDFRHNMITFCGEAAVRAETQGRFYPFTCLRLLVDFILFSREQLRLKAEHEERLRSEEAAQNAWIARQFAELPPAIRPMPLSSWRDVPSALRDILSQLGPSPRLEFCLRSVCLNQMALRCESDPFIRYRTSETHIQLQRSLQAFISEIAGPCGAINTAACLQELLRGFCGLWDLRQREDDIRQDRAKQVELGQVKALQDVAGKLGRHQLNAQTARDSLDVIKNALAQEGKQEDIARAATMAQGVPGFTGPLDNFRTETLDMAASSGREIAGPNIAFPLGFVKALAEELLLKKTGSTAAEIGRQLREEQMQLEEIIKSPTIEPEVHFHSPQPNIQTAASSVVNEAAPTAVVEGKAADTILERSQHEQEDAPPQVELISEKKPAEEEPSVKIEERAPEAPPPDPQHKVESNTELEPKLQPLPKEEPKVEKSEFSAPTLKQMPQDPPRAKLKLAPIRREQQQQQQPAPRKIKIVKKKHQ